MSLFAGFNCVYCHVCQVPKNGRNRRKFNIQIWLSKSGHLVKIGFVRQIPARFPKSPVCAQLIGSRRRRMLTQSREGAKQKHAKGDSIVRAEQIDFAISFGRDISSLRLCALA